MDNLGLHLAVPLSIRSGTSLLGPTGASQGQDAAGPYRAFVTLAEGDRQMSK